MYDLTWHDTVVQPEFFSKLMPYQKVNMYPGIHVLTKKHHLARNLMRMAKQMPEEYDFFPKTWILPVQANDLKTHGRLNQNLPLKDQMTYIVKPDSMCQGKGIFLAKDTDKIFERIQTNDLLAQHGITDEKVGYVVQQYIDRPHLIDALKYDLRLYVLLYGVNPLRIYLHQMAFARFCTEAYERPTKRNLKNIFMHLTNYALNKQHSEYEEAEGDDGDEGHKRSLGAILQLLHRQGCDTKKFMDQVKDLIIKTVITGQPNLNFNYKICQPECLDNSMAF